MELPFVSIIIPVRNGERVIGECLSSLELVDYPQDKFEVIVVDNASSDDTVNIVKKFNVKLLYELEKPNTYSAKNKGIDESKGEILVFIDADCIVLEDWLRELIDGYQNEEIGCFVGEYVPLKTETIFEKYFADHSNFNQKSCLKNRPYPTVGGSNAAYRKAVFDKIGLFDDYFFSGGDVEFSWRMQKCTNFKIKYNPKARICHECRSNFKDFTRHYYRVGKGNTLLNIKYPEYYILTFRMHVILYLMKIFKNILLFFLKPIFIFKDKREGRKLCLFVPLLHALRSISYELGLVTAYIELRLFKKVRYFW